MHEPTVLLAVETAVYLVLFILAPANVRALAAEQKKRFRLAALSVPYLYLLQKWEPLKRYPSLSARIIPHLLTVYRCRHQEAGMMLNLFIAQVAAWSILAHWMMLGLAALFESGELSQTSLVFLLVLPVLLWRELGAKAKAIKRSMLIDLPEMLTTLVLLVNAGEQPQHALIRCAELARRKPDSRLFQELVQVKKELANQFPFPHVMEQFARRCGVHEVTAFAMAMVMNYRRGGDELAGRLKEMARECWEKRKNVARSLGAEASAKMVFPLLFIFLAVMMVVAAPALMLLKE
ncbi:MAG TPA: type II secretion system F family protein [Bacilli bacterium]